jgi:gamma-tubulin complex component 6
MKLVKSCSLCTTGGDAHASSKTIHLEDILPWFDTPIESSVNSFTFSKSRAEAAICQRDAMYKSMLEKLHHFFSNIEVSLALLSVQHLLLIPLSVFCSSSTVLLC